MNFIAVHNVTFSIFTRPDSHKTCMRALPEIFHQISDNMIKRIFFLLLAVVLWCSPGGVLAQYGADGNLITISSDHTEPIVYTLHNGLTVVLYPDRSQPEVTGMVVVKTGGKDDPADATGLAHYMEHMLFKGTTQLGTTNWAAERVHIDRIFRLYDSLALAEDPAEKRRIQLLINEESVLANQYAIPNELDKILKEIGSTGINAGTGPDYTVYFNNFPGHEMERWLEIYSHRFLEPVFRSFQAELEVVYEEKNMYSDMFFMSLFEEFNRNFFRNHPYGQQSLIGSFDHLKNPSLTRMKKFYHTWYVANNMALIITGDFDPQSVIPWINEKFGKLPMGSLPDKAGWEEAPFNGRELVEVKMSPIKLGVLGYRFPPSGHPDELVLEVASAILSNSNQTGLLDKLGLENQLMQSAAINLHYGDYGSGLLLFIPKVVGQSLDNAEKLVLEQVDRLRRGYFSDTLFEAIKLNLYREKVMALESSSSLAYAFMQSFVDGTNYVDIWHEPVRVRNISRDEVIDVVRRYYGDNFLAFHSGMGFPKKEKIDKPGYEPVVKQQDEESAYYSMISSMHRNEPEYRFVDFDRDIQTYYLDQGVVLYGVPNPVNDIFTLSIRYGIGEGKMPILSYVSQMMNLSGTQEMTHDELALRMSMLGCNYSISSNDSYLTINLTGLEENLFAALELLRSLVVAPVMDQKKVSILYSAEKANRKLERSEPDAVADALREYVLYGENSTYLNRPTMREIKRLQADTLVAVFLRALNYMPEIHYVGRMPIEEVGALFHHIYPLPSDPLPSEAPYQREPRVFLRNEVYITPKKKALQSKIFFHARTDEYSPERAAQYAAFNTYFGGDFSGIVMQEVREYRSMAYAAGATLVLPPVNAKPVYLMGYIGTQSDKTNEAVDLFIDLTRNMPQKHERTEMIKRYIANATVTQRPGFRSLSRAYVAWKHRGFTSDPAAVTLENIDQLNPDDIFTYQKMHLAFTPITVIIAGDAKRFNTKELQKHGEVIVIKERRLYSK
jgi:zinc protease